jgi:hypothetical protein
MPQNRWKIIQFFALASVDLPPMANSDRHQPLRIVWMGSRMIRQSPTRSWIACFTFSGFHVPS